MCLAKVKWTTGISSDFGLTRCWPGNARSEFISGISSILHWSGTAKIGNDSNPYIPRVLGTSLTLLEVLQDLVVWPYGETITALAWDRKRISHHVGLWRKAGFTLLEVLRDSAVWHHGKTMYSSIVLGQKANQLPRACLGRGGVHFDRWLTGFSGVTLWWDYHSIDLGPKANQLLSE